MNKSKIFISVFLIILTLTPLMVMAHGWDDGGSWGRGAGWRGHDDMWLTQLAAGRPWVYPLFAALKVVVTVAIVAVVFLFLRKLLRKKKFFYPGSSSAAKIIKERYAKGEINEQTMDEMLNKLKE